MSESSSLSKLANDLTPKKWPEFTSNFPVKVKDIADPTNGGVLNSLLEKGIRQEGDKYENRTEAKCLMTRWDMHEDYESFDLIGNAAIGLAQMVPLAKRTTPEGEPEKIPLYIKESWGLVYNKGQFCNTHTHWPSLWSYTYCVKANDCCPPLIFPEMKQDDNRCVVIPKIDQLILWPAWLEHYVSVQECDCDRIMIAGNLDAAWHL